MTAKTHVLPILAAVAMIAVGWMSNAMFWLGIGPGALAGVFLFGGVGLMMAGGLLMLYRIVLLFRELLRE